MANLRFRKQHLVMFSKLDVSRNGHFPGPLGSKLVLRASCIPLGCADVNCMCCLGSGTLALEFRVFAATIADTAEEEEGTRPAECPKP